MTHQNDYTSAQELMEKGLEAVPELMRVLTNHIMQVERARYLQAGEYECNEDRKGYTNGDKLKTVKMRTGEITFAIPQVREAGFYPSALEKGCVITSKKRKWQVNSFGWLLCQFD